MIPSRSSSKHFDEVVMGISGLESEGEGSSYEGQERAPLKMGN